MLSINMDILFKIINTIALRWYEFLFLLGYIFVAKTHLGWIRMSIFSIIGFTVGFIADYSSTHNGIPFGLYHYTELTKSKELFIDNVPVITALSFIFLPYLGYNIALFIHSPLFITKNDIQIVSNKKLESSKIVCITGGILTMFIDFIIDPASLQGDKWFLGNFYWYEYSGEHFGVPATNYIGWFIVSASIIYIFQRADSLSFHSFPFEGGQRGKIKGQMHIPFMGILGVIFYISIIIFMLIITLYIENMRLFVSSIITIIPFLLLIITTLTNHKNRINEEDIKSHLEDYPYSPVLKNL